MVDQPQQLLDMIQGSLVDDSGCQRCADEPFCKSDLDRGARAAMTDSPSNVEMSAANRDWIDARMRELFLNTMEPEEAITHK